MTDFWLKNKDYFVQQVAAFETRPLPGKINEGGSFSDTVIGARVRPLLEKEKDAGKVAGVSTRSKGGYADVHELRSKVNGSPALNSSSFQLDKTYGPYHSSEDVYRDLVAPLVPWSWGGGVSTLFAYGQTGSGKTYTVNELERSAAAQLMDGTLHGNRDIYMCMFELAGNAAFDLLNDRRRISVMEDSFGESQLVGVVEHKPSSATELLKFIDHGMSFRKSAPTLKNDASSRSHAVCRIRIVNKDTTEIPDGLLFLVDLAGSEAAADSKDHSQDRMKETRDINLSLSTLKDCIRGRAMWSTIDESATGTKRAKGIHIPFRSSVLTKVLKHVFDIKGERSCKTAVLACVTPCAADAGPSKNTLRYAELLRIPVPKSKPAAYNAATPTTWSNKALKEWIDKNSGNPPISSSILAPTETGLQICKLPKGEFVSRCLQTPTTSPEQARIFYDKLFRLHIDSRNLKPSSSSSTSSPPHPPTHPKSPFQTRLKPGMFIRTKQIPKRADPRTLMLMAPELSPRSETPVSDSGLGSEDGREGEGRGQIQRRYLCALVEPGLIPDSWELKVAKLEVVGVDVMERELLLEYDSASRYYFMDL